MIILQGAGSPMPTNKAFFKHLTYTVHKNNLAVKPQISFNRFE